MRLFPAVPSGGVLVWRGKAYNLTQVEYLLCEAVAKAAPEKISGVELGAVAFPVSQRGNGAKMVAVTINRLRKKIGRDVIVSQRGGDCALRGYRLGTETKMELQETGMFR